MARPEWAVLILGAWWALGTNGTLRNHYKESRTPMIAANTQALAQLVSVVGVWVLHRSPYHLLWLFPLSYIAAFIAPFVRPLAFVSWLYGYLLIYTTPTNRWRDMYDDWK